MSPFTASAAAFACGGSLCGPDIKICRGWKSDSREVSHGDAFVAIKGEVTDGHLFLQQAVNNGAKLLLVNASEMERLELRRPEYAGITFIAAEDTVRALSKIAEEYLRGVAPHVTAITGSVGKTTTRELTAAAMKKRLRLHSAIRSFNTLIGCSLTVLAMPEDTQELVLELGTNHFGEISELVEHFQPQTVIITEVVPAHLEGFGDIHGVLRAKMEICKSPALEKIIFNNDNPLIREYMSYNYNNITKYSVGYDEGSDIRIIDSYITLDEGGPRTTALYEEKGERFTLESTLFGIQHAYNMAYACCAAELSGVSKQETAQAFAVMPPISGRGLCRRCGAQGWVIDEAYNANPASMSAAIKNARSAAEKLGVKKCAILGGMRELGESTAVWHAKIISEVSDFDAVMLLGREWVECGAPVGNSSAVYLSLEDIIGAIDYTDLSRRVILVKGSNSYGLKKVVGALTEA